MAREKVKLAAMRESSFWKLKEYSDVSKVSIVELATAAVEEYLAARLSGEARQIKELMK